MQGPLSMVPDSLQIAFAWEYSAYTYASKGQGDWLLCEQVQSPCA